MRKSMSDLRYHNTSSNWALKDSGLFRFEKMTKTFLTFQL